MTAKKVIQFVSMLVLFGLIMSVMWLGAFGLKIPSNTVEKKVFPTEVK